MGARLIRDLNPAGSSSPESIISIDGILYFTADLGENSTTDDIPDEETSEEGSIVTEENNEPPLEDSLGQGIALLKSDGSTKGTKVLKEFASINELLEVNGDLYFIADDGSGTDATGGNRLWRSDGTARGTVLVKDLYPGADPNFPQDLFEIDGVLFYSAIDSNREGIETGVEGGIGKYPYVNGYEVWRREGEGVGSRFFRNLIPDKVITDTEISSEEIEQIALDENGDPIELTKTTTVETTIDPDKRITTITTTTEEQSYINGEVVTTKTTSTEQRETVPNDLTTEEVTKTYEVYDVTDSEGNTINQLLLESITTTTRIVDIESGLITTTTQLEKDYVVNGVIDRRTTISTTQEAITGADLEAKTVSVEETLATTIEIIRTADITTSIFENDSFPKDFTGINGNYFFAAHSSALYSLETSTSDTLIGGLELWFSDGTEAGTKPININENVYTFYEPEDGEYTPAEQIANPEFGFKAKSSSSFPRELTKFGDQLVLVANDGISGFELWAVSDEGDNIRQISNLAEGNTSSSPEELTVVGNRLYFTADDGTGRKLWSTSKNLEPPRLVSGAGTDPRHLTAIQGELYFSAHSQLGRELWVADGNNANLVEDINPGTGSSSPENFTALNSQRKGKIKTQLFFTADGGERGIELWSLNLAKKSSKPERYDDILDGPTSSEPRQLVNAEQRLFFTADDGISGRELWSLGVTIQGPTGSSNGESTAVIQVEEETKKVFQYNSNSDVTWSINGGDDADQFMIKKNGWLRFKDAPIFNTPVDFDQDNTYEVRIRATDQLIGSASDQLLNVQVIDGGEETSLLSAKLVKNILAGEQSSNPSNISTLSDGDMLFAADNGKKGIELWISQGTKPSTSLLKDINKGSKASNPKEFLTHQTEVYFSANDGKVGQELWISNGTAEGTTLLKDINKGVSGSFPSDLLWIDQRLFFAADDGRHGRELWSYSTSDQSSSMVLDIQTESNIGSNPGQLTNYNGQIIFVADDEIYGRELWISDGTGSGTRLLDDINPGGLSSNPSDFSLLNDQLYFTAESYLLGERQIFKLENNAFETTAVLSLDNDNTANQPDDLHSSGNQLFYSAETIPAPPDENSSEESATDPGGFMDAADGISNDAIGYINDYNRRISEYRRSGDTFDIQASAGGAGFSANMLLDFENDASLARDWNQYFQPLTNDPPLQFSSNIPSVAASRSTTQSPGGNNQNIETLGRELWISNGEMNGNTLLMDINPGTASSNPSNFSTIGSNTYFSADDGVHGSELWVSDGTTAGTSLIVDINPGPRGSSPQWITNSNGEIYFSANRDDVGRELWRLEEDEQRATRIISTDEGRSKLKALDGNADEFRFEQAGQFGKRQADRITGFDQTEGDQLALGRDVFDGLTDIDLVTVTRKTQLSDQRDNNDTALIYFEPKGKLYFNQNGDESGYGEDGGLFAILKGGPDLSESAFRIL